MRNHASDLHTVLTREDYESEANFSGELLNGQQLVRIEMTNALCLWDEEPSSSSGGLSCFGSNTRGSSVSWSRSVHLSEGFFEHSAFRLSPAKTGVENAANIQSMITAAFCQEKILD